MSLMAGQTVGGEQEMSIIALSTPDNLVDFFVYF